MPHKLSCALSFSLISCLFLCTPAFPLPQTNIPSSDAPSPDIAEKFARRGISYYQQRNLPQALDYFSRALLLDPDNRTARENFPQISDRADIPSRQKIELYLVEDLLESTDQTRQKLAAVTRDRDRLIETILQGTHTADFIQRGLADIQERFNVPEKSWQLNNASPSPLEALHAALLLEKERLSYALACRQKQYFWLQKMQNETEQQTVLPRTTDVDVSQIAKNTIRPVPRSGTYSAGQAGPAADKTARENQQNLPFADPWEEITDLRDELTSVRKELEKLHNDTDLRNQRIIDLTKEIIEFSLKLAEKEMTLTEKVNTLASLHEAYANIQSRLALGQRIIEEKNTQIQSLEESLASLQGETVAKEKQVGAILSSKDKALLEWEGILVLYRGKLKEATRKLEASSSDVTELHEQLTTTRAQLFEKESALEKVKSKLAALQTQLQPAQDQDRR
ncbi:MAG: tetratricopeptide repeat protein [Candidatus Omnitrophica bacterium]|nr:tetratricopeptide repeat protein [Candidatus Omnitrophota bacterium]